MRCDLHVHTRHSGMCTIPGLQRVCRESYNDPAAVYEKLKRLGMGLVTITDHDSIGAVEQLRSHPDFFLSQEVTVTMPGGSTMHVGVYDITERDHIELERRRTDLPSLLAYLDARRLFFSANHVFSSLTGRRLMEDFEWVASRFPAIETQNSHMLRGANHAAALLADRLGKAEVGGSDAHAMPSVGCAFTVVRGARTREEFMEGLRRGYGRVRGISGGGARLTREVAEIACKMVREHPATVALAPLLLALPLVTFGNYIQEGLFLRYWLGRALGTRTMAPAEAAIAEIAA